jgi:hypothetical protein
MRASSLIVTANGMGFEQPVLKCRSPCFLCNMFLVVRTGLAKHFELALKPGAVVVTSRGMSNMQLL